MGQKTERIRELEGELAAERYLLRRIGDAVGCEFEPPTTTAEANREHQRFAQALLAMSKGAVVVGALGAETLAGKPRRPRPAAPGSWDTHDEEVEAQIDRLEAQGLTTPLTGSTQLVQAGPGYAPPVDVAIGDLVESIAGELGLNVTGMTTSESLGAIHEEIVRVKNLGADVEAEAGSKFLSSGKSLGQAIAHDHAQATELRDELTRNRTIVMRLAAVMQIGQWDKDGTELLERAQRWEGWKHDLMRRIRELRAGPPAGNTRAFHKLPSGREIPFDIEIDLLVAEELHRQLDRLLSPKELANWLKANEKSAATGAVKVDIGPPVTPYPFEVRPADASLIQFALEATLDGDSERLDSLRTLFQDIANSRMSAGEFARTMNLVILPILARQRAAQKVPEDATRPATE